MTPTVIFVRVNGKPQYNEGAARWLDSYLKFLPGMIHELVIINRYEDGDSMFDGVASRQVRYDGGGWDCGSWLFAARNIASDLLVCFNSSTRIMGCGWLDMFVGAVKKHGAGLYGPLTSFEIVPHVRTPCMIFPPEVMRDYPGVVDSREATYQFESLGFPNIPNVTQWCRARGAQTRLITWDGCYDLPEWRNPANIFRRGDQSNLIVHDRHCDAYAISDAENKAMLEKLADGRR